MTTFAISQPMKGKTAEQIRAERNEIIKEYEARGWTFVDTYIENCSADLKTPGAWFFGKAMQEFANVDVVIFAPGWREAPGCLLENDACDCYKIAVIEL